MLVSGLVAGRVLNRFAKDIGQLDSNLPWTFVDFVEVRMDLAAAAKMLQDIRHLWGGVHLNAWWSRT